MADTADLGGTYDSGYSKQLRTLQLSSGPYDMTLAVSSRRPGLMAAGTQDNGNIFCYRESHRPWWFRVEGG